MHEIFISYRRADSNARQLKADLDRRFYRDVAFRDVESASTGDLSELIQEKIRSARFVLFLITRDWINHASDLTTPNNFLRLEIEKTLSEKKTFIPVFIGPDVKTAFHSRFFDRATGTLLSTAPSFARDINDHLFVELDPDDSRKYKMGLGDLFEKLEPGLSWYWRRKARWRWAGYSLVVLGAIAFLVVLGSLGAFSAGYAVEQPWPTVARRERHPSGSIDLKLREPPPNVANEAVPLKDKHQNWMDHWIQSLTEGVLFKDQIALTNMTMDQKSKYFHKRLQVSVSKQRFGKQFQTFSAALNTKQGFRIDAAYAFLVRNDGPEASYAPVYRQMVVNIDNGSPYRHNATFTNPRADEEILVLVVLENKRAGIPFEPSNDLLKLEVN